MAYLDSEAVRAADKGEYVGAYNGFRRRVKTLRMTRQRRLVLLLAESRVGLGQAGNKYTFHKVSQIAFSQGFASPKCMYFRKLSQIRFRRNT